jgi:hypothetical protein
VSAADLLCTNLVTDRLATFAQFPSLNFCKGLSFQVGEKLAEVAILQIELERAARENKFG